MWAGFPILQMRNEFIKPNSWRPRSCVVAGRAHKWKCPLSRYTVYLVSKGESVTWLSSQLDVLVPGIDGWKQFNSLVSFGSVGYQANPLKKRNMALVTQTQSWVFSQPLRAARELLQFTLFLGAAHPLTVGCVASGIVWKVHIWNFRITWWNTCQCNTCVIQCNTCSEVALCPGWTCYPVSLLCD